MACCSVGDRFRVSHRSRVFEFECEQYAYALEEMDAPSGQAFSHKLQYRQSRCSIEFSFRSKAGPRGGLMVMATLEHCWHRP